MLVKEYVDDQWLKLLTDQGVFFVTRLRVKSVYTVRDRRPIKRTTGSRIIHDGVGFIRRSLLLLTRAARCKNQQGNKGEAGSHKKCAAGLQRPQQSSDDGCGQ